MDAYAPASVTAVFAPNEEHTHTRGVSFALSDGVTISLNDANNTAVSVDGEPASFEPVEGVLDRLGVTATVDVQPAVPIGAGFGTSGAATLATALAANEQYDLELPREELVERSRAAEVAAGTGLGDVYIQDTGGLLYDLGNGKGRVETNEYVEYSSYGDLPTADALDDSALMEKVRAEGSKVLEGLTVPPTLREVVERSWPFAQALGLPTQRVVEDVERAEAAGGAATMAMLGESVIAVGCSDVLENRTTVDTEGAHLL